MWDNLTGIGQLRPVSTPLPTGSSMLIAVIDLMKPAQDKAHDLRAAREQKPQRIRDAQHPLAHGMLWEELVDRQRRTLGHAPGTAQC